MMRILNSLPTGRIVYLTLPPILRNTRMGKWLQVLCYGITNIYNDFATFRNEQAAILKVNGQTIVLEKFLRDRYPYYASSINIINLDKIGFVILFKRNEVGSGKALLKRSEGSGIPLVSRAEYNAQPNYKVVCPYDDSVDVGLIEDVKHQVELRRVSGRTVQYQFLT